jgi:translation initiation factor IF-1
VPIRCYLFSSCLGDLFRWYEETGSGRMRMVLILGEYSEDRWRVRAPDVVAFIPVESFDKRGDVTRVG